LLVWPLVASPIEDALKRVIRVACRETDQPSQDRSWSFMLSGDPECSH
jgi:hypothetical protein